MTVADLIAALQGMDQSLPVVIQNYDSAGYAWRYPKKIEVAQANHSPREWEPFDFDTPGELSVVVIS